MMVQCVRSQNHIVSFANLDIPSRLQCLFRIRSEVAFEQPSGVFLTQPYDNRQLNIWILFPVFHTSCLIPAWSGAGSTLWPAACIMGSLVHEGKGYTITQENQLD